MRDIQFTMRYMRRYYSKVPWCLGLGSEWFVSVVYGRVRRCVEIKLVLNVVQHYGEALLPSKFCVFPCVSV